MKNQTPRDPGELRRQAEAQARATAPAAPAAQTPQEIEQMLHELRVHQIELEMQNEELRTAQALIEAGRARYFDLYDLAPVGYCTLSEQGLILEANLTAVTLLNTARSALLKQPISRFILKEDQDNYYLHRKQLLATGAAQQLELRLVKPDGAFFWAHLAEIAAQADDGAPVVRVTFSDINERKRAADELKWSEDMLSETAHIGKVGGWSVNIDTRSLTWTDEVYRIHELDLSHKPTVEEAINFYTEGSRPVIAKAVQRAIECGEEYDLDLDLITAKGNTRAVRGIGKADLKNRRIYGFFQDNTERKASEQRFRDMVNTTDGIVWEADARTFQFTFISKKAVKLLGFPAADWLEPGFWVSRLHPDDATWAPEFCASCTGRLEPHDFEYRFIARDGRTVWLHDIVTVVAEQGEPRWLRGIMVDITAHKQAEIAIQTSRDRLNAVLQTTLNGYWLVDLEGHIIDANDAAAKMLGYTREALLQLGLSDIDAIEAPDEVHARIERMLKSGGERFETKHRKQSGEIIDVEASISFLPDGSAFVVFVHDITQRKLANLALEESERAFRKVLEASNEGVLLLDSTGAFVECNQAALDLLKMTREQFIKMTLNQISVEFQPNGCRSEEYAPAMTALGWKGFHRFEWACRNLEGAEFIVEVSLVPITLRGQSMLHCTWHNITKRKQMEEQVRHHAFFDTLTQLPNRRLLHDRLSLALATSKRNRVYGALLFLDLDNFKPLNDTHGHDVGDLLLIEAARRLQSCVRAVDTVSRFGGDEFVVVISELEPTPDKSVAEARKIAEKIRAALSETYFLTGGAGQAPTATPIEHHCTVSIGVEMFFDNVEKSEELMKKADAAMYRAKEAGRNQIQFRDSI